MCPSLEERYGRGSPYWHLISHIPGICTTLLRTDLSDFSSSCSEDGSSSHSSPGQMGE
ncbi:hypothetical protein HanPSC8_Chr13g0592211 [Helianthus annuus]|nr:hypothetical protein HanPSC8_Chr13g0592211 [Helianthus annuus]